MHHSNIIFAIGIIITLLSCEPEIEQSKSFPSEELVSKQMDSIMRESDLPGLVAIAINKDGESIKYTYGNAIWTEDTPISVNSIFRIASMTKLLTSVAVLQLVEKDSIGLDQDLSPIMPEMVSIPILTNENNLIEGDNPITLRQLLTHTSGFGYSFTDSLLAKHDGTDWNYEDYPRRFESGTQFLYGTSTDWVGKLIEKISGLNLEEYLRKNVTGPLKMDRTWFNVPDTLRNEIVSWGGRGDDGAKKLTEFPGRVPTNEVTNYEGGGGLYSSPEDYIKILACLINDGTNDGVQLLQKTTIDEMFINQIGNISMDIEDNYYKANLCCNFKGLIKPTSKWGLAGLIDTEPTSYGRKKGTLLWGGILNTYWYIDLESGVAASIYTQHLPFNHQATTDVFDSFSQFIYTNYN